MRTRFLPEIFPSDETLHLVGTARHDAFANNLRILVWNIYKGRNKSWENDFLHLTEDRNLVLLQESVLNTRYDALFESPERYEWIMAKSYKMVRNLAATGVKTGSSVASIGRSYYLSPDLEPLFKTPKMILVTTYEIPDSSETLLVVNVHAINFVGIQKYNRQLLQITEVIDAHKGPVILAGDFNTWSYERYKYLQGAIEKMGLQEASLVRKARLSHLIKNLDHIFYRGLTLQNAEVLFSIKTSDHYPIVADFSFA
jgi:endonuclease/exonuclease/phosphatase (EEP) superfamily protein YafD